MAMLDHVRWIGGGTGAGNTTIVHRLADESRLAVYSTDAAIRAHTARLGACAAPLLESFRQMSMDERWVLRDPEEMYRTFPWFHGEGFNLLVEDLRSLPEPGIVLVEGLRLLPDFVRPHLSDPNHAVWFIPTPEFRRAAFARAIGRRRSGCARPTPGEPWRIFLRAMKASPTSSPQTPLAAA